MLTKLRSLLKNKKGQSLVEYGIIIGGVALVSLAAVALLGHKTNDIIATVTAVFPGAHADDQGVIVSGKLVNTINDPTAGGIILNTSTPGSIATNVGLPGIANLVVEPATAP